MRILENICRRFYGINHIFGLFNNLLCLVDYDDAKNH